MQPFIKYVCVSVHADFFVHYFKFKLNNFICHPGIQTMALAVSCLTEIIDCLPNNIFIIATTLSEIISTEIRPLGDSVLVQTLFSALYTKLIEIADKDAVTRTNEKPPAQTTAMAAALTTPAPSSALTPTPTTTAFSKSSICTMLAEAVCSIDEDNKHTECINNLIAKAQTYVDAVELHNDTAYYNESIEKSHNTSESGVSKYDIGGGLASNSHSILEFTVDSSDNVPDLLCGDLLKTSVGKQCVKVRLRL